MRPSPPPPPLPAAHRQRHAAATVWPGPRTKSTPRVSGRRRRAPEGSASDLGRPSLATGHHNSVGEGGGGIGGGGKGALRAALEREGGSGEVSGAEPSPSPPRRKNRPFDQRPGLAHAVVAQRGGGGRGGVVPQMIAPPVTLTNLPGPQIWGERGAGGGQLSPRNPPAPSSRATLLRWAVQGEGGWRR